jgi:hypothetical protein
MTEKWWAKFLTKLAWAPKHKETVDSLLLAAVNSDAGADVVNLLSTHFEGAKGLTSVEMTWKPSDAALVKNHGFDEGVYFDTDLLSVLYQNRCINTLQAIAKAGWLTGREWVWYSAPRLSEKGQGTPLFAAPLKHAAFAVKNGHLFWIQKEDALRQVWGPKNESTKAEWICKQILFSTYSWDKVPSREEPLKTSNFCPPPTEETMLAWIERGWVSEEDLVKAQAVLVEKHAHEWTKTNIRVVDVIPPPLLAKAESVTLKKRTRSEHQSLQPKTNVQWGAL